MRCPSCAKLYEIQASAIFSASPHFQCVGCPTLFTFDFPPEDPAHIPTRRLTPVPVAAGGSVSPAGGAPKARPTLARKWKALLEDYANESKHQAFVMACREMQALDFARSKYEEMRRLQGSDDIADRFLARITGLETVEVPASRGPTVRRRRESFLVRWKPFLILAPFMFSAILIAWGIGHPAQRNMVGAGIAVALLSFGLLFGWRDRSLN